MKDKDFGLAMYLATLIQAGHSPVLVSETPESAQEVLDKVRELLTPVQNLHRRESRQPETSAETSKE